MTKRTAPFNLILPLREAKTPAFRWLYAALRADILAGRLRPGSRLPATRDLATQYGLSRGTVVSAFEELKSEGYLHGSRGSGTYVSSVLPENLLQVAPAAEAETLARSSNGRAGFPATDCASSRSQTSRAGLLEPSAPICPLSIYSPPGSGHG